MRVENLRGMLLAERPHELAAGIRGLLESGFEN
jgi:hypothetical protein